MRKENDDRKFETPNQNSQPTSRIVTYGMSHITMAIAVVGLGKLGLPLAVQYAMKGLEVIGLDSDSSVVDEVNRGRSPHSGEAELQQNLERFVREGNLTATTAYSSAIPSAQVVVVVVPLLAASGAEPDFQNLDGALNSIGLNLSPNTLVIVETTVPIGTTRNRLKPILEQASGLQEGRDFYLVFSPERVMTGRVFNDLKAYPKIIGSLTKDGAQAAISFYQTVLDFNDRADLNRANGVWDLCSAEAAEMVKLVETTYRDVNIALANQFASHAEELDLDIFEIIEAANSQPYSHIHSPGISVGGHCIPVYSRLYSLTDPTASLVSLAREVNESVPVRAVDRIVSSYGSLVRSNVLILGLAYRPGVKEHAFSGVFELEKVLRDHGATTKVLDPLYSSVEIEALGLSPANAEFRPQIIILHTAHPDFSVLSVHQFEDVELVFDGRNFLKRTKWEGTKFISLGSSSS